MADPTRSPAKKRRRGGKGAGAQDGVSEQPRMPESSWGLCFWCLRAEHDPSKCASREVPDMSDFARSRTSGRTEVELAEDCMCKGCTGSPTVPQKWLSRRAYEEHIKKYNSAHKAASRACRDAAKQRAAAFAAQLARPLQGSGPLGQFSVHDVLAIKFSLNLDQHLSPEQLQRPIPVIDNAAVQVFAKWLNGSRGGGGGGIFRRADDARFPGERAVSSFFLLSMQVGKQRKEAAELVAFYGAQERLKHSSNKEVAALTSTPSLWDVLRAVQRKPGRPSWEAAAGPLQFKKNWVEGGYSAEAMLHRARMDTRRIQCSARETQGDVVRAVGLVVAGTPSTLEALRRSRPSRRPLQVAHATTARLHLLQLNKFHAQESARRVVGIQISWDEGTAGGHDTGRTAVVCGASGNVDGDPGHQYRDMFGLRVLDAKTGRSVANALVDICKSRGISVEAHAGVHGGYFMLTDAVSSNIGHVKGAIAYLRDYFQSPLIFPIRCEGHITARTWAHALMKCGGRSTRPSVKRRSGGGVSHETNKTKEVMLLEDTAVLFQKMPDLRQKCQDSMPETLLRVSGSIDTRWQYTAEGFRRLIGASVVRERLLALWVRAMHAGGIEVDRESMSPHEFVKMARAVKLPLRAVQQAINDDSWMSHKSFSGELGNTNNSF